MDEGFKQADKRFEQVGKRLEKLDERFDRLYQVLLGAAAVIAVAIVTAPHL